MFRKYFLKKYLDKIKYKKKFDKKKSIKFIASEVLQILRKSSPKASCLSSVYSGRRQEIFRVFPCDYINNSNIAFVAL